MDYSPPPPPKAKNNNNKASQHWEDIENGALKGGGEVALTRNVTTTSATHLGADPLSLPPQSACIFFPNG